jgi:ribosomal protein RSM22 (predicted rRNA methylase)
LYRSLWGDVYCKDVEMTENIMSEEQYNELLKAYTKEALASMIKADIRSRFPESYASIYCQQFDDFKNVADFFEVAAKLMRR